MSEKKNPENATESVPESVPEVTPQKTGPTMVKLVIPMNSMRENEDVQVAINGKTWLLQRGEEVEVPDFVAEEYKRAETMERLMFRRQKAMLQAANVPKN